jgi:fluoride exporter
VSHTARFFLVCLAGAAGTGARFLVGAGLLRWLGPDFPSGTLAVNLTGSLLLGVVMELALHGSLTPDARLVLAAGFMGGFTTYSSFNYELLTYLERGAWALGGAYLVATVLGCLVAGGIGVATTRWIVTG